MEWVVDGHGVYAATGNHPPDPDKETIVFLHGAGQDHSIWLSLTRYFAHNERNVLAVDFPGHGRSGGAALETVEALADWTMRVLAKTGLPKAAVVGHSLGALVAIAAAARHPQRVRSIALVGVTVPMPVSERLLQNALENRREAIEMLNHWGHGKSVQAGSEASAEDDMIGAGIRLMAKAAPGVIHTDLKACNDYRGGIDHAAAVICPALLILGERDRLTPVRSAAKLTAALPDADQVVIEGAGHFLPTERPADVLALLDGFL